MKELKKVKEETIIALLKKIQIANEARSEEHTSELQSL